MTKIAVTFTKDYLLKKARKLASKLNLPLIDQNQNPKLFRFLLIITPKRLELREAGIKNAKPIFVDFLSPELKYRTQRASKKNELIAKAISIKNKKHPTVIDATAGFGVDAFIMASLGCKVTMLERSPVIRALLEDGLERLGSGLELRMESGPDNGQPFVHCQDLTPEIIYLDPMYPEKTKSALNKKKMRILHEIVGDDKDAPKLLELALKHAKNRVVVKRPKHAEYLGGLKPDLELSSGRSSRYDVYLCYR